MSENLQKYQNPNPIMKLVLRIFRKDLFNALKGLDVDNIETILDIGCGEGFVSIQLARLFPGAKIKAFDVSKDAIDYANIHNKRDNIDYYVADAFKIRVPKVSLTTITEVLEHVKDPERILDRMSKKSRYMLVSVPNRWFDRVNSLRGRRVEDHINEWSKHGITRIMSNYGKVLYSKRSTVWTIVLIEMD